MFRITRNIRKFLIFKRSYHKNIIDHYENPRNVGKLDKNKKNVGTGLVGAPACGDVMKLQLKINDNGIIEDAKFKPFGCGSAIASSSLVTEWVKGRTLEQAKEIARGPHNGWRWKEADMRGRMSMSPLRDFGICY